MQLGLEKQLLVEQMLKYFLHVGKGLGSPKAPAAGPCQKWTQEQMNPGFNPIVPFLCALPQYKYLPKLSIF